MWILRMNLAETCRMLRWSIRNLLYWARQNFHFIHRFSDHYLTILHQPPYFLYCVRISVGRRSTRMLITFNSDSAIFETITSVFNLYDIHSVNVMNPFYVYNCFWLRVTEFYTKFNTDFLLNMFCHFEKMHNSDEHGQDVTEVFGVLANNCMYALWPRVV